MTTKALIIDGNSIINRAFFGIKGMATPDGFPTNAIYGFFSIYHSVVAELKPEYIAVAFDLKGPTFRHLDFDGYKATRKGMPDELAMQLPIVKEILDGMGILRLELQGFEADDLIGTSANYLARQEVQTYILTGDKDALQLVDGFINVYYHGTKNKKIYTPEDVKADLGVYPNRVTDLKGLMGDSSDNIPGVPSIGKVTANKLLEAFDTVEILIEKSERIANARQRELIETHAEQALMSKRLATIEINVPLDLQLSDFAIDPLQADVLVSLFQKYHLHSFLQKLELTKPEAMVEVELTEGRFQVVTQQEQLLDFLSVAIFNQPIVMVMLYDKQTVVSDRVDYIALYQEGREGLLLGPQWTQTCLTRISELQKQYQKPLQLKGHDLKQMVLALKGYAVNAEPAFDTQIAMYLIDANRKSYLLNEITLEILGRTVTSEESLLGKGAKRLLVSELSETPAYAYLEQTLEAHLALEPLLAKKMEELDLNTLFKTVEMPLIKVLAHMEYDGFKVDLEALKEMDLVVSQEIATLENSIYELAGESFNINSPKQLGVILFEKLALPTQKKTKTGYSTSHEVLVQLASKHDIIDHIMHYRVYTKIKSTYIDGLQAVINPITGRVHSSLNQTVAATGRLSSTEPNLQNIPIRIDIGRRLRKVFVPKDDTHLLVDADYSQIELRILAHLSDDPMLKRAYTEGIDIHALTASQVFDVPLEEMTPQIRNRAKEVNFGIVYGMSDFGLSETLKIPRKTAKLYIENYFVKYPNVKAYMKSCVDQASILGYSETLLGRKRFIPEIKNKNFNIRQYGERMAMNTPIQGTAADIIKVAMIRVFNALEEAGLKSRLILQVHDELIIDTCADEVESVQKLVHKAMTEAVTLSVPLEIDMHVGSSWYDAK